MDHLLRERLGLGGDDCGEEHEWCPVRDHVRHVDARRLRKVHKPLRGHLRKYYDTVVSAKGPAEGN